MPSLLISVTNNKSLHETRDYLQTLMTGFCLKLGVLTECMATCSLPYPRMLNLGKKYHSFLLTRDLVFALRAVGCSIAPVPMTMPIEDSHEFKDCILSNIIKTKSITNIGSGPADLHHLIILVK